ncbi:predicted protein [Naegleria gruberi]|uniref:Predicted protein n=1 Tax=Naegleria gruberi TaxID=5762 RepID=D2V5X4_NAEGR|nr:uncharacterized protein NAEGRDRAFT_64234 [Naegleria gruberi]EFC47726.1 predicted protein [Naegleria gruberi]|eukprot:XP_002680470.1 predicted protein [Naegleria gruberi strain NEG-M]
MEQDNLHNSSTTTQNNSTHSNDDDDIWGEEEFRVDGQNDSKSYDQYVASLNFDRMRDTFVTLGIKDGVSEGLDEARQVYFEKGLVGGIREGIVCGFLIQLMSLEGLIDEEKRNKMKSESVLWKKEKMDRVMEMILSSEKKVVADCDDGEGIEDEDLRMIREVIEKHTDHIEMFKATYESILRH